jgi:hypothetical protein
MSQFEPYRTCCKGNSRSLKHPHDLRNVLEGAASRSRDLGATTVNGDELSAHVAGGVGGCWGDTEDSRRRRWQHLYQNEAKFIYQALNTDRASFFNR